MFDPALGHFFPSFFSTLGKGRKKGGREKKSGGGGGELPKMINWETFTYSYLIQVPNILK